MECKDPLTLPPPEVLREIAAKQDAKAAEIQARRKQEAPADARDAAAQVIQKNYRGYRARRALQGYGLDSNARWIEALKEGEHASRYMRSNQRRNTHDRAAQYYNLTSPISRETHDIMSPTSDAKVRARWKRVGTITSRAAGDDTSSDSDLLAENPEEMAKLKERKRKQKKERDKYAKLMGLDYFLEMVDHNHRYGSNLRRYHAEWKKSDTKENFFYWLDYGEGKDLDLEDRPRSRLDSEYVRYLSKEDRKKYLVKIDNQGRFCYVKNDMPVTTSVYFKDSIDGIVPVDDDTPTWREVTTGVKPEPTAESSDTGSLSGISTGSQEDSSKYVNSELHESKGLAKVTHVNADAVMNHMLRKTTKKNTWIFVADTSFRLYIGIKQSGAFQHSSFLRGARVSAAGLIKVKRGQLRKLSPLSGHYAPPVKNFHEFLKSLKEAGADLSHLNTSRSYAVLLGLEGYIGAKKHMRDAGQSFQDMFDQDGKRQREEAAKDKSKSAQREREILEQQAEEKRKTSFTYRLRTKLGFEDRAAKKSGQ